MAGALGVRLGGTNHYAGERHDGPVFHPDSRPPIAVDIGASVRIMLTVAVAATILLALVVGLAV
jgi:adenosylcobinamide-phosphate synthase